MTIKITIPNTSSDTLTFGSGNTPTAAQIAGIDSGSSNGQLALYTTASGTSTERVRIDSSGNVGIGGTPGSYKLNLIGTAATLFPAFGVTGTTTSAAYGSFVNTGNTVLFGVESSAGGNLFVGSSAYASVFGNSSGSQSLQFATNNTVRTTIDSSGNLIVNATAQIAQGKFGVAFVGSTNQAASFNETSGAGSWTTVLFQRLGTTIGSISNATSSTAYNTSSDYRLKNSIAPMTGALAKVAQLKPVTYKWNIDDEDGEGFIAHELAEVCPNAVTGEKDAVDADGNPVYQGIDTSFLVATLTAALQEAHGLIKDLQNRVNALEKK